MPRVVAVPVEERLLQPRVPREVLPREPEEVLLARPHVRPPEVDDPHGPVVDEPVARLPVAVRRHEVGRAAAPVLDLPAYPPHDLGVDPVRLGQEALDPGAQLLAPPVVVDRQLAVEPSQQLPGLAVGLGVVLRRRPLHEPARQVAREEQLRLGVAEHQLRRVSGAYPGLEPLPVRPQLARDVPVGRAAGLDDQPAEAAVDLEDERLDQSPAHVGDHAGVRHDLCQQLALAGGESRELVGHS